MVITINNSAIIIIFNALWKSLAQKSQRRIPLTLSIENVGKEFWNEMVKAVDGVHDRRTSKCNNIVSYRGMEKAVDLKETPRN